MYSNDRQRCRPVTMGDLYLYLWYARPAGPFIHYSQGRSQGVPGVRTPRNYFCRKKTGDCEQFPFRVFYGRTCNEVPETPMFEPILLFTWCESEKFRLWRLFYPTIYKV